MWIDADLDSLVDRLGRPLPSRTKSRRHGHRAKAPDHVRRWAAVVALGARPTDLARTLGIARSTLYESLSIGERIARQNAGELPTCDNKLGPRA